MGVDKQTRLGRCQCGCGELVNPNRRFVYNHHMKGKNNPFFGKKHTEESLVKMRGENNPAYKGVKVWPIKYCKCGCGELVNKGNKFVYGHAWRGRSHSKETVKKYRSGKNNPMYGRKASSHTLEKLSKAFSGENNPAWRGGIAGDPYCPIFSDQEFKEMIFERDNYECQNPLCRKNCNHLPLIPHHINYDKMDCDSRNVITVCWSCNSRANWNRKFWEKHYKSVMEAT